VADIANLRWPEVVCLRDASGKLLRTVPATEAKRMAQAGQAGVVSGHTGTVRFLRLDRIVRPRPEGLAASRNFQPGTVQGKTLEAVLIVTASMQAQCCRAHILHEDYVGRAEDNRSHPLGNY